MKYIILLEGNQKLVLATNKMYLVYDVREGTVTLESGSLLIEYIEKYSTVGTNTFVSRDNYEIQPFLSVVVDYNVIIKDKLVFIAKNRTQYIWYKGRGYIYRNLVQYTTVIYDTNSGVSIGYDDFMRSVIMEIT